MLFAVTAFPVHAEGTIRIGYQKYGTLVLLKTKGLLEEKLKPLGVSVEWTEFPAGPQLLEALNVGAIDYGTTGEAPPIFAQAAGAPLVYVGYEPPAPGGEAILVPQDSPLQTVADLKGKNVALNKGSNVHYLLVKALEKEGVAYSEIQTSFLPPADARAAFEKGAVDAWVIWDPFLAAAEAATGARQLADGTGIVQNHQFYLASRSFVEARPDVVDVVFEAIGEIDEWVKASPGEVAAEFSPALGIPAPILEVAVEPAILRHQADRRRGRGGAAEDRRHVLRARPHPERDQDRRRRAEAAVVSAAETANVLWFLPTHGDGRYLGTAHGGRAVDIDYLGQVARAADALGYFGVLLPTGKSCEDSWVVASALAPQTERLRFLVAVRPGLQSPSVAARMTATLDRISHGRLLINVVTGGDPVENKGDGIFLSHDERYEVTREFLEVYCRLPRRRDGSVFRQAHPHRGRAACSSSRSRNPIRRSISAARRAPASMLRPRSSTNT